MRLREQGMTLLEVVLSVLVLSFGLFASAAVQMRALQAGEGARRDAQGVYRVQALLEQARSAGALDADALQVWQAQVRSLLGASAEGQATAAGSWLQVELRWHDARDTEAQFIALQGRVLP